jgi:biopolymer transport protein ExbD
MHITGRGKKLLTEINMVPFIDIVLVLLIIFMILSPLLVQSQIQVNLPQAVSITAAQSDQPVKVQVTHDGSVYISDRLVPVDRIEQGLKLALMAAKQRAVIIEADKTVPFENVVRVLDAAEQLEAVKVGVAVLPQSAPTPSAQ